MKNAYQLIGRPVARHPVDRSLHPAPEWGSEAPRYLLSIRALCRRKVELVWVHIKFLFYLIY